MCIHVAFPDAARRRQCLGFLLVILSAAPTASTTDEALVGNGAIREDFQQTSASDGPARWLPDSDYTTTPSAEAPWRHLQHFPRQAEVLSEELLELDERLPEEQSEAELPRAASTRRKLMRRQAPAEEMYAGRSPVWQPTINSRLQKRRRSRAELFRSPRTEPLAAVDEALLLEQESLRPLEDEHYPSGQSRRPTTPAAGRKGMVLAWVPARSASEALSQDAQVSATPHAVAGKQHGHAATWQQIYDERKRELDDFMNMEPASAHLKGYMEPRNFEPAKQQPTAVTENSWGNHWTVPVGAPGPRGPPGYRGAPGAYGKPGEPGKNFDGDVGSPGFRGSEGPQGPTGDRGGTGQVGPPGSPGEKGQYNPMPAEYVRTLRSLYTKLDDHIQQAKELDRVEQHILHSRMQAVKDHFSKMQTALFKVQEAQKSMSDSVHALQDEAEKNEADLRKEQDSIAELKSTKQRIAKEEGELQQEMLTDMDQVSAEIITEASSSAKSSEVKDSDEEKEGGDGGDNSLLDASTDSSEENDRGLGRD